MLVALLLLLLGTANQINSAYNHTLGCVTTDNKTSRIEGFGGQVHRLFLFSNGSTMICSADTATIYQYT